MEINIKLTENAKGNVTKLRKQGVNLTEYINALLVLPIQQADALRNIRKTL